MVCFRCGDVRRGDETGQQLSMTEHSGAGEAPSPPQIVGHPIYAGVPVR